MVEVYGTLADIGCDHAHTSIYLCENNIVEKAIAADINEGPLKHAKENVTACGLSDRIELRLSDGLKELKPGEADTILISGMGGELMARILSESKQVCEAAVEFILQPQSELSKFRHFLHDNSYEITREAMTFEDGKFYTSIRAVHAKCPQHYKDEYLYKYGILVYTDDEILAKFLDHEAKIYYNILYTLKENTTETAAKRRDEVNEELRLIDEARKAKKQDLR